ncbi:ABC transporter ATP-binding protein/permease [Sphingomonas sp. BN140010]|uniref:ABC transporter ATP-binding protein/permease n=1 Tax=Sphingomonas arvum TaxID=2992113 RepID=A0ABT3JFI7_9SPHN|nr:ABC transporter ATP-binding protein/permease [Sphingomonas sp. BN140010]MCW3797791.1 ABC transporter ATP-binding protein/permease [Sphingomonas sp. BN140010]
MAAATEPDARPPAGFRTLWRFLPMLWPAGERELKSRVTLSVVLVLVGKALTLVMPFAYKAVIDRMSGPTQAAGVVLALVVAYAAARFGGVLSDNLRNAIFEKVGQGAARRLAARVFRHVHSLSLRFHLERRTGSLTKIVERGTKSIDMMLYFLLFNIAPTVIELTAICIIFYVKFGGRLVLATLAIVAIYIGFTRWVTDWRAKLQREMNEVDNKAIGRAVDSLLNYETVKYFGAEEREARRYDEAVGSYTRAAVKNEVSLAWLNIGQSLITNTMMAGAMGFTVWGWARGRFTPGDVVLVNSLLMQLFRPLDMLGWVYRSIRQGLIDMEAMFDLTDTPAEVTDRPGAPDLVVGRGELRFEDVHFGYDPEREILKGVSFTVPPGTTLAIVGPSGAGKSTLARLIYRFYDPQGGRILIDGQDITAVTQASLRSAIGIVPQDTVLFNDTIGYNIGYGRDGASQAEIEAAAGGASIDRFIAALPDGYEAMVGERGLKLSGGEKQRVAIARTLLKNPPVLILDEATSALDSRTEEAIQDTLNRVSANRTTITIAHRLSTVVGADQIMVLDAGQVAERGTHGELLRKGGLYAELWARQAHERALEEAAE